MSFPGARMSFWIFSVITLIAAVQCLNNIESPITTGKLRKGCTGRGFYPQPEVRVNTAPRLEALRKVMVTPADLEDTQTLDAVLVTSEDEHQTEFVSNYDKRREYISGFSGSSGDAIVTQKDAVLWVAGQYHLQADDQLNCNWTLMRVGIIHVPTKAEWLSKHFPKGARIGADPKLMSADSWSEFEKELNDLNKDLKLAKTRVNVIDKIWANHSETEQEKEAFSLNETYAGKKWTTKVKELRAELNKVKASGMVITALDEIAWLLNIRGRDIPYTRFIKSYVLLSETEIILYVDKLKITDNVTKPLDASLEGVSDYTVVMQDYDTIWSGLKTYCQKWKKILVPSSGVYALGVSKAIYDIVPEPQRISMPSPITYMKAQKNPIEIMGMHNAHIRDAAAMCKFIEYFETRYKEGDPWDELKVAIEVDRFRLEQDLAVNVSFRTIAAFGPRGAQPHYEPTSSTSQPIFDNSTLIIDSGGQYCDGTTDVTRTLHLGEPTDLQKDAYTRVLMGSIQLSTLIFPENLEITAIDVLARAPLWEIGEDYPHATGHGVGAFLGVHEAPILVHYNSPRQYEYFKSGYFFSNEPGIYYENKFGVRLENVLEVIEKPNLKHHYGHAYLGFKDVTLVPYSYKLMNFDILSVQQKRWLNDYNARIRKYVGAELKRQLATDAFYWMMDNTKYIPEVSSTSIIKSNPLHVVLMNIVILKFSATVLH